MFKKEHFTSEVVKESPFAFDIELLSSRLNFTLVLPILSHLLIERTNHKKKWYCIDTVLDILSYL